jgi:hypothetical protein
MNLKKKKKEKEKKREWSARARVDRGDSEEQETGGKVAELTQEHRVGEGRLEEQGTVGWKLERGNS